MFSVLTREEEGRLCLRALLLLLISSKYLKATTKFKTKIQRLFPILMTSSESNLDLSLNQHLGEYHNFFWNWICPKCPKQNWNYELILPTYFMAIIWWRFTSENNFLLIGETVQHFGLSRLVKWLNMGIYHLRNRCQKSNLFVMINYWNKRNIEFFLHYMSFIGSVSQPMGCGPLVSIRPVSMASSF